MTAPFLFSYAIPEIEMIFPFPVRGSGCCSYGVSIPADYKTRRGKLLYEVSPSGFCFISLQSDGVDINHFAVFDLNIALEAAQQRGNRIHRGQARDCTLYRGTADVYRAKLRMTARSRSTLHSRACMPSDHPDLPHGRSRGWSGHPAFHRRGTSLRIPPPSLHSRARAVRRASRVRCALPDRVNRR